MISKHDNAVYTCENKQRFVTKRERETIENIRIAEETNEHHADVRLLNKRISINPLLSRNFSLERTNNST